MRVSVSQPTWHRLAGLPGPILAKGVKFGFTLDYPWNFFFGRWRHAKRENRSKVINPRAAAWPFPLCMAARPAAGRTRGFLHFYARSARHILNRGVKLDPGATWGLNEDLGPVDVPADGPAPCCHGHSARLPVAHLAQWFHRPVAPGRARVCIASD